MTLIHSPRPLLCFYQCHLKKISTLLKLTSVQPQICSIPFNIPFRTYLLVDPNEREERVMDGLLVIAMNKHREICTIQSSGGIMLLKDQVSASVNVRQERGSAL